MFTYKDAIEMELINDNNIKRGKSNDIMNYHINRKTWQILWDSILGNIGFGDNDGSHFENDVFECKAYCWNDYDDDVEYNKYHFWHKPSGFKIQWYKYALRGAECNMKISDNQFVDILYDCANSLEEGKKVRFLHDVDKWWEESDNTDE